ncbi:LysR substrate-binding domain-containing protein [Mixta sp. Marseille-Q2659]|uniref:LysR substrate-binding domain-containing protein n=1 Tax=Mixta sp. Marseille-Q2659 TaxID=2736607 RepID=UPI0023BA17BC|nr:LysR substrate-binding domain-containing protein [Mixta sp. Marseille-Q2659]
MDFNDLYYFYLVAENSGYTAAEKNSGITKSLLSRRVVQLEERLKVRLVQRNSRSFALTTAGNILLEHAKEMVREGINAYDSVSELVAEPSGVVRLSSPTVLAQYHLAPIIPGFMARYPNVRLCIDATDRHVQVIEERIDLSLRARKNINQEPGLVARILAVSNMILVASPVLLEHYGVPDSPEELESLPTISSVLDRNENEQRWDLTNKDGANFQFKHRAIMYCTNPRVQFEAVIHGIGVGLLPDTIVYSAIRERKLIKILEAWKADSHVIHAVFPSRKHMNPAVRAFLDYLILHLPGTIHD